MCSVVGEDVPLGQRACRQQQVLLWAAASGLTQNYSGGKRSLVVEEVLQLPQGRKRLQQSSLRCFKVMLLQRGRGNGKNGRNGRGRE